MEIINVLPPPPPNKTGWPWTRESNTQVTNQIYPKISIITPSYNQGFFIEKTIRSILLQGYPNLEYIIIDGGSSDNTIEIIKKYEQWITFWVSEPDNGQSHAINKGLKKATGDIIAWLNSDDCYVEGIFEKLTKLPVNFNDQILISGTFKAINQEEQFVWKPLKTTSDFYELTWPIKKIIRSWNGCLIQPSTFWTKTTMLKTGFLDESLFFAMDLEYWLRAKKNKTTFYFFDEILSEMTYHSDAKSVHSQEKNYQNLIQLSSIYLNETERKKFKKELNYHHNVIRKLTQANGVMGEKFSNDYLLIKQAFMYSPMSLILHFRLYLSLVKKFYRRYD